VSKKFQFLLIRNDPADISAKLCSQAHDYMVLAQQVVHLTNKVNSLKMRLKARRESLYMSLREKKKDMGWSEADIESRINTDHAVVNLTRSIQDTEVKIMALNFGLEALRMRYGSLKILGENLREESREPFIRKREE
jgi:beta-xylosidase